MKVSVIVTTFKRADMLTRAIDSVLAQTYENIEIIVVDDNDENSQYRKNTEEKMLDYKKNKNIKYIKHKKNMNGSVARNTGIKNATGSLITFLDDDDIYFPQKVEKQVEYLLENKEYKGVYCSAKRNGIIKAQGNGDLSFEILSGRNLIYTNTIMMWKEAILNFGGWDETYQKHQEAAFLLRFFSYGYKIGSIPEVLVKFDISDRSNVSNASKNEEQVIKYLFDHKKIIERLDKEKKGSGKKIYLWRYRGVMLRYIKEKNLKGFFLLYKKCLFKYPISINIAFLIYSIRKLKKW